MLTRKPPVHRNRAIALANHRRLRPTTPDISALDRGVLPNPAILVVSDDSLLRWALYEALVAARFRVLACSDEAHAREILPQVDVHPALAIIDDEAWPMTRSERTWLHALWPDLPILALAHHGQALEHRVKELGLADVLLKPFDVPHLIQTVERLIAAQTAPAHQTEHHEHAKAG
jgi:DNA-binding response OmpR family regulator